MNHIIYEFYSGRMNPENILNESRGIVSGLHKVVKAMCKEFYRQVEETFKSNTPKSETYQFSTKEMGFDTFFDKIKVILSTTPSSNGRTTFKGGLNPMKTFQMGYNVGDELICSPDIFYNVQCGSAKEMIALIESCLGHELTHAFNLYQYGVKNNLKPYQIMSNYRYAQGYAAISTAKESTYGSELKRPIGQLLYSLNRMERGAYIAQLKEELEAKADEITDSKSAWQAVLDSDAYRVYSYIERNVGTICSNDCTLEQREDILQITNDIMNLHLKTYNQVQKWYGEQWYKWKTKFITTAAKIAYDVYADHNDLLDGDQELDEDIIKPF